MSKIVNDKIFGEMEYKHRWIKEEVIDFWGKTIKLKIIAKAYSGKPIAEEERQSYSEFLNNIKQISEKTKELVCNYVNENIDYISKYWDKAHELTRNELIDDMVYPKSVLFYQDGSCVILCDCIWDIENGIGIQVFPTYKIGTQDLFL